MKPFNPRAGHLPILTIANFSPGDSMARRRRREQPVGPAHRCGKMRVPIEFINTECRGGRMLPWSCCLITIIVLSLGLASGCASITFPANGIPVYRLPEELLSPAKDNKQIINLALLKQPVPNEYLLGPGDVLGVWIAGVLGSAEQGPPVRGTGRRDEEPSSGVPIRVRPNGTILLPLINAILVKGMTIEQAEGEIRKAYLDSGVLAPGLQRVLVSLIRQRQYNVIVIRQEQGIANAPRQFNRFNPQQINRHKRGTGHLVDLPAYRNDVLTALAESGGFPGLDAHNEIIIYRSAFKAAEDRKKIMERFEHEDPSKLVHPPELIETPRPVGTPGPVETNITRIPLRVSPGEPLCLAPEDIILQTGDVVYIEARDPDVFYTGGLLPTGEWPLPRDYDLSILEALALVQGPLFSGGLQTNSVLFSQQLIAGELGGPSPSRAMVIRRTANGGQVSIRVDLDRALTDSSERITIHPGDFIILQQTPGEALARYATGVLRFDLAWKVFLRGDAAGVANARIPDRLPLGFSPFPF